LGVQVSDSLLPHNATAQERALEAVIAPPLMPPVPLREIWDPETCPANLLPWLAFAFSVDEWSPDWPEAAKREVIRQSFQIHRRKGTVGAMRRALEAVFDQAQLREWFDTGDAPHTFRVALTDVVQGSSSIAAAKAIIKRTKPARSHLNVIQVQTAPEASLRVGSAVAVRISQTIDAVFPRAVLAQVTGAALSQFIKQEIPAHG
jgi:phage tail P2-like protein